METRRMVVALAAAMLVFFAWTLIGPRIFPSLRARGPMEAGRPATMPATQPGEPGKAVRTGTSGPVSRPARRTAGEPPGITSAPVVAASSPAGATSASAEQVRLRALEAVPQTVTLGSDDPSGEFDVMLKLNSRGASVDDADLAPLLPRYRNYPKGDPRADREPEKAENPFGAYEMLRPVRDQRSGATYRSMSTQEVNILFTSQAGPTSVKTTGVKAEEQEKGQWVPLDLSDRDWEIERRHEADRDVAVCRLTIEADGKPLLRLIKTYTLFKRQYDVTVDVQVESLDGRPHEIILTQDGPIHIRDADPRNDSRKIYFASRVGQGIKTGRAERKDTFAQLDKDKEKAPRPKELPGVLGGTLLWAALGNQYFAAIMTPVNADRKADMSLIKSAEAYHTTSNQGAGENSDLTFRFVSRPVSVAPNRPLDLRFDLYVGPKERNKFQDTVHHPAYVERDYMGTIQEEYAWCVWNPLAELMSRLLIGLHDWIWPHNWGFAIIILVLIVRVILHPLTKKGQVSMSRMQSRMAELAPKIEEIKKKYASDRNKMNQETMALYRKEGVNPAGNMMNCLPMVLQMPIWVALWASLSNTIELRHASFIIIPGRWILDLAAPDALYRFAEPVPLLFFTIDAINILPFLWGISMILQQKLTPHPKRGQSTEQMEQQQRIMYFTSVLFTVMFYNFQSGLTMYIMASNFIGIAEQWRIRKHIEAEDARRESAPPPEEGGPGPRKSKGLMASLMDKIEKFDQRQRAVRSSKKK